MFGLHDWLDSHRGSPYSRAATSKLLIAILQEERRMGREHAVEEVLEGLVAQAASLWGQEDAERQRPGLQVSAEQIVHLSTHPIPVDLEPRFF
jgi:hypothetical protein